MLNTCLTVRAGDAGSHSNRGWEQFTDKVVDIVDKYGGANLPTASADSNSVSGASGVGRGVVFLAWGAWAAKRVAKFDKVSCYFRFFILPPSLLRRSRKAKHTANSLLLE